MYKLPSATEWIRSWRQGGTAYEPVALQIIATAFALIAALLISRFLREMADVEIQQIQD